MHTRRRGGFLLTLATSLAIATAAAAAPGAWTPRADMPTARNCFAVAVVDGSIYTFGGRIDPLDGLAVAEAYDTVTDSWRSLAPMPTPGRAPAAVVVDGRIITFGGHQGDFSAKATGAVGVYDPVTDTWAARADMPRPRSFACAELIDGMVYVLGGWAGYDVKTVEAYDPATDTWTDLAPMPVPWHAHSSAVVDGKIYVVREVLFVYDPATNQWARRATPPRTRGAAGLCAVDGMLYLVGGRVDNTVTAAVDRYDPVANTWCALPPMPAARTALNVAAVDGIVYAMGGAAGVEYEDPKAHYATVEAYTSALPRLRAAQRLFDLTAGAAATALPLRLEVDPAPGQAYPELYVGLSPLGGGTLPMDHDGSGTYTASLTSGAMVQSGPRLLPVYVVGEPAELFVHARIQVWPVRDFTIPGRELAAGWHAAGTGGASAPAVADDAPGLGAGSASELHVESSSFLGWTLSLRPPEPLSLFGYRALRLVVHPGDATGRNLNLAIGSASVQVLGRNALAGAALNLENRDWQILEVPLSALGTMGLDEEEIDEVRLIGNLTGTLYVQRLELVAAPNSVPTAVTGQVAAPLPRQAQTAWPTTRSTTSCRPVAATSGSPPTTDSRAIASGCPRHPYSSGRLPRIGATAPWTPFACRIRRAWWPLPLPAAACPGCRNRRCSRTSWTAMTPPGATAAKAMRSTRGFRPGTTSSGSAPWIVT